jgi:hypothetical protein
VKSDATVFLRLRFGAEELKEHKPIPWQEAMKLRDATAADGSDAGPREDSRGRRLPHSVPRVKFGVTRT